jgi:hypothetical protein
LPKGLEQDIIQQQQVGLVGFKQRKLDLLINLGNLPKQESLQECS